jgi:hypothetical protein
MSTSLNPSCTDTFTSGETIEGFGAYFTITAYKGQKALQGMNVNEFEVTFPPGTSIKITGVRESSRAGVMMFEAEVV